MKMKRQNLEYFFPNVLITGGVLKAVSTKYPDFITELGLTEQNISSFDIWYISKSGEKPISKLLQMLSNSDVITLVMDNDERLIVDHLSNLVGIKGVVNLDVYALADVIYQMFSNDWKRLAQTFNLTYDITSPYNMSVSESGTSQRSSSNTNSSTGSDSGNSENNNTVENKVSAFDSSTYQSDSMNTDDTSSSYSNNRSTTWGGSSDGNSKTSRNIQRKGNIGNKTTQEILQEERELRLKVFWDYIRKDLDRVLTLPIYI